MVNKKRVRSTNGTKPAPTSQETLFNSLNTQLLKMNSQASVGRRRFLKSQGIVTHEGRRDTWGVFGYPPQLRLEDFRLAYLRSIGGSIIDLYADETWKKPPPLFDGQSNETDFVQAWDKLVKDLKVWEVMNRLDKAMQLGQYALLFLGMSDAENMESLANKVKQDSELRSLSVISEIQVETATTDKNPSSPRFRLPKTYNITFGKNDDTTADVIQESISQVTVHWSRVLHVTEGALDNKLEGQPRLQRPFNTLLSLGMVVGSTGEGFWRNVSPKYAFTAREGYDTTELKDGDIQEQIELFLHGMRDYLLLTGVDLDREQGRDVNGRGSWEPIAQQLSGEVRIPFRILFGNEAGELASSQDESNWAGRISSRQITQTEPNQLRPFIDRLVKLGVIPNPDSGSYDIGIRDSQGQFSWPPTTEVSAEEAANIAQTRASAAKTAAEAAGVRAIITEIEIRDDFAGLTPRPSGDEPRGEALTAGDLEKVASNGQVSG